MNRLCVRAAAVLAGAAGALVLAAGVAQAHVRVSAPQAVVSQPATFDFRVPSEEQVARTIRVSVTVPSDVPISSVSPMADWISVTAKDRTGDTVITWTSQGGGLLAGDSTDFHASVSALPDRTSLSFDVVQTYSNGDMVYWNQAQVGATQPPYPAPILALGEATPGAKPGSPGTVPVPAGGPTPPAISVHATGSSVAAPAGVPGLAIGLAVGGGIAIVSAAVAITVVLRRRPSHGKS
jgi:uncharacterized protein YcnI